MIGQETNSNHIPLLEDLLRNIQRLGLASTRQRQLPRIHGGERCRKRAYSGPPLSITPDANKHRCKAAGEGCGPREADNYPL